MDMKTFPVFAIILLCCALAAAQGVTITTTSLPAGTVNIQYSATIDTARGDTPFTWSTQNFPSGLTLTPSRNTRTATLSGMPTQPATYSFEVTVTGAGGHVSTETYTLTISSQGGTSYSAALTWNAGASGINGYNVYRSNVSGGPYSQINTSLLPSNNFSDTTVSSGNTYYYVTTEVNGEGQESGYSNEAPAVVP